MGKTLSILTFIEKSKEGNHNKVQESRDFSKELNLVD